MASRFVAAVWTAALATAALLIPALLTPVAADAATVVIWPVDPVLSGTQQATALWLENKGDTAVTLQVRSLAWSQDNGEDVTADQDAVVASPPIAHVGPGQRQMVRIIRRQPDAPAREQSYRLFVDELPPPPGAAGAATASAHLSVKMRYAIPLFVQPTPAAPAPHLVARIVTSGVDRLLAISNDGTGRARLTNLRLAGTTVQGGLIGYVLPGATMTWPLPPKPGAGVTVAVNGTDQILTPVT